LDFICRLSNTVISWKSIRSTQKMDYANFARSLHPSFGTVNLACNLMPLRNCVWGTSSSKTDVDFFKSGRLRSQGSPASKFAVKAAVLLGVLTLFANMEESCTLPNSNPNGRLGKLVGSKAQCAGICLGGNSSKRFESLIASAGRLL
jgi:hypothetical protein